MIPEVSPTWRGVLGVMSRLPQGALSRSFGRLADVPLPRPVRPLVLGAFARALRIDVDEAERPIAEYGSLNDFFVRRLRPGARRWPDDPGLAGSPVDGIVGELGTVARGRAMQAKGRGYSTGELLGDVAEAERFEGGSFLTLYLSPRHYHRIHTPTAGTIPRARHLPGALLPVNQPAVAHIADLFARNERLICYVDGPLGRVAVAAIGAYNVGRISAAFDPHWSGQQSEGGWVTNRPGARPETRDYQPPIPLETGQEIMAFHLGSTVVLLLEPPARLDPGLQPGGEVRLGQPIARGA